MVKFFKKLLTKHVYIHKIDKVYVNIKTKKFSLRYFDRYEKIFSSFGVSNSMNDTDFELVREIVNEKYDSRKKQKQD